MTEATVSVAEPRFGWGWWRQLPMVLQRESAECGLACLAMIASYYGNEIDLPTLRSRFPNSAGGTRLTWLVESAEMLGLQCRALRLDLSELQQIRLPCLLHMDLNHFVVLKCVRKKHIVIHDPAFGERRLSMSEFSHAFTGVALEMLPGPQFSRAKPAARLELRQLTGRIVGLRRAMGQIFSLALVLEVLALASPLFVQTVMDQVLNNSDFDLLLVLGLGFLLLVVVQTAISALRSWSVICLGVNLNLAWTGNVFGHLLKLPEDYFRRRQLGDVVTRFGALGAIQQTLTARVIETALDGIMVGLTLLMLFLYNTSLAVVTLAGFSLYVLTRVVSYRVLRDANLSQIAADARQQTLFLEAVRGATTIRLNNQRLALVVRYMNRANDTSNRGVAIQSLNLSFGTVHEIIFGMLRIVVLWTGARLVLQGQLTAGMLMAFLAYSDQFRARAANLIDFAIQFRMLHLQGELLADIVLTPPESGLAASYTGKDPDNDIACENLSFRYSDNEPWILRQCSFRIDAGESVAIVGASGSGKSTLVKLLSGLLDPQAGNIQVGGVDLRTLGKTRLRQLSSTVLQDDTLFSGSVRDNISFFDPEETAESVEAAAIAAGVHEEILRMPMGYHTPVGDMGSTLSGGQRQRICLARALYRKPRILLLDEATSHLDVARERQVSSNVAALQLTRVIVAHRPETVRTADRVLVLADGQLHEIPAVERAAPRASPDALPADTA